MHPILVYRDELEAALARADALERELELLRRRAAEVEHNAWRPSDWLRAHPEHDDVEPPRDRRARSQSRRRAALSVLLGLLLAAMAFAVEDGMLLILAWVMVVIGGVMLADR